MELVEVMVQLRKPTFNIPDLSFSSAIMYSVEKSLQTAAGDERRMVGDVRLRHHMVLARVARRNWG